MYIYFFVKKKVLIAGKVTTRVTGYVRLNVYGVSPAAGASTFKQQDQPARQDRPARLAQQDQCV
jgi:hypothetical protein